MGEYPGLYVRSMHAVRTQCNNLACVAIVRAAGDRVRKGPASQREWGSVETSPQCAWFVSIALWPLNFGLKEVSIMLPDFQETSAPWVQHVSGDLHQSILDEFERFSGWSIAQGKDCRLAPPRVFPCHPFLSLWGGGG